MVEVKVGCDITIKDTHRAEEVFAIRGKLLSDYGITFDTGAGAEGFDWFLDWSLQHNDSITREEAIQHIKDALTKADLKYEVTMETYEDI